MSYGYELILDLEDCDVNKFNRNDINSYFEGVALLIGANREVLHFWDYEGVEEEKKKAPSHLKGTSAVQFISTSSFVIHTLDDLRKVFLNIFSCGEFDPDKVLNYSQGFFNGKISSWNFIKRG